MIAPSTPSSARSGRKAPVVLCLALHIVLILVYVTLIVVASHHYEHGLNLPFTTSGELWLSLTVSAISQTFGTASRIPDNLAHALTHVFQIYLAVLVLATQHITLANNFYTRQTLTAIHDKLSAWLGLGSSLSVLSNQIARPAALSGVTAIALYLGDVAILHIAIPTSFTVNVFNSTHVSTYATQLARLSGMTL